MGTLGEPKSQEHKKRISEALKRNFEQHPERRAEIGRRFTKHGLSARKHGEPPPLQYRMWEHAKKRARDAGIPFNIEPSDVVIPEKCPLLGIALQSGTRSNRPASPSLDRKIPALGYVKGNVWVISFRANAIKNDASLEELEMIVNNWRQHHGYTK